MKAMLLGALGGGALGLVAGFVVAIVVLQLRRLRNARLMRAGVPPIRDVLLPPFHIPGVLFGLVLGGALAWVLPLTMAIAIGGAAIPLVLLVICTGITIHDALERPKRAEFTDGPPTER